MGLASNANVHNTCLRILHQRGYVLRVEGELDAGGYYPTDAFWIAEKDGFHFCGNNPIELLGLIAIHDHVQPKEETSYWWVVEGDDIWSELMEAAFPDEDVDEDVND